MCTRYSKHMEAIDVDLDMDINLLQNLSYVYNKMAPACLIQSLFSKQSHQRQEKAKMGCKKPTITKNGGATKQHFVK